MQFQTDSPTYAIPSGDHVVTMRNRKRMDLTSVKSIDRFDQEEFLVRTSQGLLQIRGEELRIVHLDVDKGLLTLEGTVATIQYDEEESGSKGFLHKLFG
ncbi:MULTISPECIES: sporulation protein YabP [unclassified Sporosarcina]|jgi:sporulation protein YabP|uniref:Sporulation protein YabP n=1 Tax=Sporosarcina psychrophila TaxID=1476 RepID=A0A921G190_SPOPS|nr:sporulation protein YabP [Sporosarcina sp. JAI121]NYF26425.1 sporulation protein YabP [Sporosarcina sp. JAI121]HJF32946.1 sporulation protein YabP [Sporosarcina psychrophila]